ncbi:hypothetical protein HC891_03185 [Candidatus Gracilibacteria bacterium]|nr:hypothetical protein [Candidatus Gracilibacteria bacterium]
MHRSLVFRSLTPPVLLRAAAACFALIHQGAVPLIEYACEPFPVWNAPVTFLTGDWSPQAGGDWFPHTGGAGDLLATTVEGLLYQTPMVVYGWDDDDVGFNPDGWQALIGLWAICRHTAWGYIDEYTLGEWGMHGFLAPDLAHLPATTDMDALCAALTAPWPDAAESSVSLGELVQYAFKMTGNRLADTGAEEIDLEGCHALGLVSAAGDHLPELIKEAAAGRAIADACADLNCAVADDPALLQRLADHLVATAATLPHRHKRKRKMNRGRHRNQNPGSVTGSARVGARSRSATRRRWCSSASTRIWGYGPDATRVGAGARIPSIQRCCASGSRSYRSGAGCCHRTPSGGAWPMARPTWSVTSRRMWQRWRYSRVAASSTTPFSSHHGSGLVAGTSTASSPCRAPSDPRGMCRSV